MHPRSLIVLGAAALVAVGIFARPLECQESGGPKGVEPQPRGSLRGGKSLAVVIGVHDYANLPKLAYCGKDAKLMKETLTKYCQFDDVFLMFQPGEEDAGRVDFRRLPSKSNLDRELKGWLQKADAQGYDRVLIYFSGHGAEGSDGRLYLAPFDCDRANIEETGLALSTVKELLDKYGNVRVKLLVLDCCHAGKEKGTGTGPSGEAMAHVFTNAHGVFTLASCEDNEASLEWPEKKQGLFTYWLCEGLKGPADGDLDGIIDHGEVFKYVYNHVYDTSWKELGQKQTVAKPTDGKGLAVWGRPGRRILNYIADDFIGALILRPQEIARSPMLAPLLKGGLLDEIVERFGFDARALDRAIFLLAPRKGYDYVGGDPGYAFVAATILQFAQPPDKKEWATALLSSPRQRTYQGKTTEISYFADRYDGQHLWGRAVCWPDERTLIITEEETLQEMLAASEAPVRSPLGDQLRHADLNHDAVGVLVLEPARELFAKIAAEGAKEIEEERDGPAGLIEFTTIPSHLTSLHLIGDLNQDTMIEVVLNGRNAESPVTLGELAKKAHTIAKGFHGASHACVLVFGENLSKWVPPAVELAGHSLEGISISQDADRVVLRLKKPERLDELCKQLESTLPAMWIHHEPAVFRERQPKAQPPWGPAPAEGPADVWGEETPAETEAAPEGVEEAAPAEEIPPARSGSPNRSPGPRSARR